MCTHTWMFLLHMPVWQQIHTCTLKCILRCKHTCTAFTQITWAECSQSSKKRTTINHPNIKHKHTRSSTDRINTEQHRLASNNNNFITSFFTEATTTTSVLWQVLEQKRRWRSESLPTKHAQAICILASHITKSICLNLRWHIFLTQQEW